MHCSNCCCISRGWWGSPTGWLKMVLWPRAREDPMISGYAYVTSLLLYLSHSLSHYQRVLPVWKTSLPVSKQLSRLSEEDWSVPGSVLWTRVLLLCLCFGRRPVCGEHLVTTTVFQLRREYGVFWSRVGFARLLDLQALVCISVEERTGPLTV